MNYNSKANNSVIMSATVSMLIVALISSEVCAQINPRFHYSTENRGTNDEPSSIDIPESVEEHHRDKEFVAAQKTQGSAVPLELIEQINNAANLTEFFENFIDKDSMDSSEMIASRFGDANVERSTGILPKPATCIPQPTVVPLEPINMSRDPTVVYFPSCTRVNRCGGCCSSPLLSCQPTIDGTELVTFSIYKSQYTGGTKMAFRGKENVLVEVHKSCKCDCRIKKSDCKTHQVYDATQCKCMCTNYDEQEKCVSQADKIWDPSNCNCRCRFPLECTSGTYFDEHQCRCIEKPQTSYSRIPASERRKYIVKATPVFPDNDTKYHTDP